MRLRTLLVAAATIVASQVLAACGDPADQDLCGQFADLAAAADDLQALDPLTAKVEDLRATSEDVEGALDQFQSVSEGRLDTAISTLRADVDAVRQAAVEAGADAVEAARPLLEDSMDDVSQAWAVLKDLVDTQCDVA